GDKWKRVGQELRKKVPAEKGRLGTQQKWSLEAWRVAKQAWDSHGHANKLVFSRQALEQDTRDQARRYWERMYALKKATPPQPLPAGQKLTRRQKRDQADAIFGMPLPPE